MNVESSKTIDSAPLYPTKLYYENTQRSRTNQLQPSMAAISHARLFLYLHRSHQHNLSCRLSPFIVCSTMATLLGKHSNNKKAAVMPNKKQGLGQRTGTIISAASVPSSSQSSRNVMMSYSSSTECSSNGLALGWQAELFHEYLARKSKVQPTADNSQHHQE